MQRFIMRGYLTYIFSTFWVLSNGSHSNRRNRSYFQLNFYYSFPVNFNDAIVGLLVPFKAGMGERQHFKFKTNFCINWTIPPEVNRINVFFIQKQTQINSDSVLMTVDDVNRSPRGNKIISVRIENKCQKRCDSESSMANQFPSVSLIRTLDVASSRDTIWIRIIYIHIAA